LKEEPDMATIAGTNGTDRLQELFLTGLKNAHAMEKQALSIMTPQVQRVEHYPEVAERLRKHIEETNEQLMRIDEIFDALGSRASALKDTVLGVAGELAAVGHSFAGDEILKNSFANYAFEHFEMASYKSLIVMSESSGLERFRSALEQNLREEEAMAAWIDQSLPLVTRRYMQLYVEEGAKAAKI
jgi:ferritin-like metal-binding protein YciE